jgi:phage terminase small subunit
MTKTQRRRKRQRLVKRPPDQLPPQLELFLLEYEANGHNGTKAYRASHPACRSNVAAAVGAYKVLRNPQIVARLEEQRKERWLRLKMDADEALARISIIARADIGDCYDAKGELLPVHQWPDSVRLAVKSIKPGQHGDTVILGDQLRASELMAIAGGKLKSQLLVGFDHAKYLGAEPPEE